MFNVYKVNDAICKDAILKVKPEPNMSPTSLWFDLKMYSSETNLWKKYYSKTFIEM